MQVEVLLGTIFVNKDYVFNLLLIKVLDLVEIELTEKASVVIKSSVWLWRAASLIHDMLMLQVGQ